MSALAESGVSEAEARQIINRILAGDTAGIPNMGTGIWRRVAQELGMMDAAGNPITSTSKVTNNAGQVFVPNYSQSDAQQALQDLQDMGYKPNLDEKISDTYQNHIDNVLEQLGIISPGSGRSPGSTSGIDQPTIGLANGDSNFPVVVGNAADLENTLEDQRNAVMGGSPIPGTMDLDPVMVAGIPKGVFDARTALQDALNQGLIDTANIPDNYVEIIQNTAGQDDTWQDVIDQLPPGWEENTDSPDVDIVGDDATIGPGDDPITGEPQGGADDGSDDGTDDGFGLPDFGNIGDWPGIPGIPDWIPDAGVDTGWPGIPGIPGTDNGGTPTGGGNGGTPTGGGTGGQTPTTGGGSTGGTPTTGQPTTGQDNGVPVTGGNTNDGGSIDWGSILGGIFNGNDGGDGVSQLPTDIFGTGGAGGEGGTGWIGDLLNSFDIKDLVNQTLNFGLTDYAADKYQDALRDQINFNQGIYNQNVSRLDPYNQLGIRNIDAAQWQARNVPQMLDTQAGQMAVNPNVSVAGPTAGPQAEATTVPVNQIDVTQMTDNPFYQAMLSEANRNVENSATTRGRLKSGGTDAALAQTAAALYGQMMPQFQQIQSSQDQAALASDAQRFGQAQSNQVQDFAQQLQNAMFQSDQGQQNVRNRLLTNDQLYNQLFGVNNQTLNRDDMIFKQLYSLVGGGQSAAAGQGGYGNALMYGSQGPLSTMADVTGAQYSDLANQLYELFRG